MKSFLTGSHVYGKPTEDSDLDLVILTSEEDADFLINKSESGLLPCRYAKLNLILIHTDREYFMWKEAMEVCLKEAPIDRERAVAIHIEAAEKFGLGDYFNGRSG